MPQSCLMDMNLLGSGVKGGVGGSWGGNLSVAPGKQDILICHAMVENAFVFPQGQPHRLAATILSQPHQALLPSLRVCVKDRGHPGYTPGLQPALTSVLTH